MAITFGLPSTLYALHALQASLLSHPLFMSSEFSDWRCFLELLGGPAALVLIPLMWLCIWIVRPTLSGRARRAIIVFALWSTFGGAMFWLELRV